MPAQDQMALVPRETSALDAALAPIQVAPGISIVPLLKLQSDLEPFDANAENIEGQVSRAEIASLEHYQGGSDILSAIQAQLVQIEALRVATKKPADDYGKLVQKLVTPVLGRLQEAKNTLQLKMLKWRNEEEARQRAAQEAIRKQQQEEADRVAAELRAKGNDKAADQIEEMVASAPTAPAPKISVPNYTGKTHGKRTYWLGDVQDPMEICRRVVSGELPIHVIEFSKSGMNAVATKLMESIPEAERTERVHLGIKISKSEKLV
jgi:hypothetical protein